MNKKENISLRSYTTLRVGGEVPFLIECASMSDIEEAVAFARKENLPFFVLGAGSNLLAPDQGYPGVLIRLTMDSMTFVERGDDVSARIDAGVVWDTFVTDTTVRELWGVENLAGIPGTVGAAPVQNIGAYGMEVKETITEVEVFDTNTNTVRTLSNAECEFSYRESRFKRESNLIIVSVTFLLRRNGTPRIAYTDLSNLASKGTVLERPFQIADAVRLIRSRKFPDLSVHGTAGSFFKNPVVSKEKYDELKIEFPELPGFVHEGGYKLSLAWVLDKILNLKGFSRGHVRLFEAQPLVLVTEEGATEDEVEKFAQEIKMRVKEKIGIEIEREVRSLK